mmetsp:Transcript_3462/g.7547  ORF Transcript_3462/g.7547 Transcript_3462/m.7547 type:complete len:243 (-) Transcript_3462:442-1170(-)
MCAASTAQHAQACGCLGLVPQTSARNDTLPKGSSSSSRGSTPCRPAPWTSARSTLTEGSSSSSSPPRRPAPSLQLLHQVRHLIVLGTQSLQLSRGHHPVHKHSAQPLLHALLQRQAAGEVVPQHGLGLRQAHASKVDLAVDAAGADQGRVQLLRVVGGHHHDAPLSVHHAVQGVEQACQVECVAAAAAHGRTRHEELLEGPARGSGTTTRSGALASRGSSGGSGAGGGGAAACGTPTAAAGC